MYYDVIEAQIMGELNEKELTNFTACGLSNGVFGVFNDPKKVGTGYNSVKLANGWHCFSYNYFLFHYTSDWVCYPLETIQDN